jgi:hypothetical protein
MFGQKWAPALFSRFRASKRTEKKEHGSAMNKEREKNESAERERKSANSLGPGFSAHSRWAVTSWQSCVGVLSWQFSSNSSILADLYKHVYLFW